MTSNRNLTARSYLFVPGDRPERFEKAHAAGPDVVILDLEDAVGVDDKAIARDHIVQALRGERPVAVRINGAETPWFEDDIVALTQHPGVAAIILPKAEIAAQIDHVIRQGRDGLQVLPIIETARGYANLSALCSTGGVPRVAFGTLDFQIDLGMDAEDAELLPFRAGIVMASRLAGIAPPVDGVSTVISDAAATMADARRGRRIGFGGKLCIHPAQIATVHQAYAYTDEERAWSKRVLGAVEHTRGGAIAVDGKMIDSPVIAKARRIAESES